MAQRAIGLGKGEDFWYLVFLFSFLFLFNEHPKKEESRVSGRLGFPGFAQFRKTKQAFEL